MTTIACRMSAGFKELASLCSDIDDLDLIELDPNRGLELGLSEAEGLIVYNSLYTAELAATVARRGSPLRWIQFATSGIDNAEKFGVPSHSVVCNSGEAWAPTVAEHAMALLLGLIRKIHLLERFRPSAELSREALSSQVCTLWGRRIAIVGVGATGREVARRAKAFDAHVVGIARTRRDLENFDEVVPTERFLDVARDADAIVLCVPLTPQTRGLINAEALANLKSSTVLVNVSRGAVINEVALVEALGQGRIAGAGLDVFAAEPLPRESPLRRLPNVILSPHIAGFGDDGAIDRVARLCLDNVQRFIDGRPLRNVVELNP